MGWKVGKFWWITDYKLRITNHKRFMMNKKCVWVAVPLWRGLGGGCFNLSSRKIPTNTTSLIWRQALFFCFFLFYVFIIPQDSRRLSFRTPVGRRNPPRLSQSPKQGSSKQVTVWQYVRGFLAALRNDRVSVCGDDCVILPGAYAPATKIAHLWCFFSWTLNILNC